jgi:hypothetical protein
MNDAAPKKRRLWRYVVLMVVVLIGALVFRLYLEFIVPPLVHAVRRDDLAEVKRLVEQGAQVRNSYGSFSNSPLHAAISEKMIDYLISDGADVNAKNDCGNTPLHLAAILRNARVVESLLKHGADVHSLNNTRETPLHVSLQNVPSEPWDYCGVEEHHPYRPDTGTTVPRLLIRAGAELRRLDGLGHDPLYHALRDTSQPEIAVYINSLLRSGSSILKSEWETLEINELNPPEMRVVICSPGYQTGVQIPDTVEILWEGRQIFEGKLPTRIPGSGNAPIRLIEIGTQGNCRHRIEVRHGGQSKKLDFWARRGKTSHFDLLKTADGGEKTLIVERSSAPISP